MLLHTVLYNKKALRMQAKHSGTCGMNAHEFDQFRSRLLDKKKLLLQSVKKNLEGNRQPESRMSFELVHDNPDRSVDELLKHVTAHVLGGRAGELDLIESALLKISEGNYGKCESCGEQIDNARLNACPEAVFCIACQNSHERNARTTQFHGTPPPQTPGLADYLDDDE